MAPYQTQYPIVPDPFSYRGIYPSAPYSANYPLRDQYGVPYLGTAPYVQGMGPMSYADPGNQYPYDSNNFAEPHPNQQHPAGFSGQHPHAAPQPPHADYEAERTGRASTHDQRDERYRKKRTATKSASHKLRKRVEDLESRLSELSSGSDSGRSQLDSLLRALSPSRRHNSPSSSGSSGSGVGSDQLLLEVIRELLDRDKRQRDRRELLELLEDPNVLDKMRSALWDMYGPDGPDDNSREGRRRSRGEQYFTVSDVSMEPASFTSSRTRPLRHSTAHNLYQEPSRTSRTLRQGRPQRQTVIFADTEEDSEYFEQVNQTRGPRRYALNGPMLAERTFVAGNRDNISRRRDGYDTDTGNQRRNRHYRPPYVTEVTDEDDLGVYER